MPDLTVNGVTHSLDADPAMPLLWALRDLLGLRGTKFGCGIGACGACTVHLDGQAVRSCVTTVQDAAGKQVLTIEGLGMHGEHPVQRAWKAANVPQCGYCQPGQIMQAAALLKQTPKPTDQQIVDAMSGNICRCGTYQRIKAAIRRRGAEDSVMSKIENLSRRNVLKGIAASRFLLGRKRRRRGRRSARPAPSLRRSHPTCSSPSRRPAR